MNKDNLIKKQRNLLWRTEYESGLNLYQIAKKYGRNNETVRQGIHRAGGKTFRRARKYFINAKRERQIKSTYGIVVSEMEWLKQLQKSLCLWCFAPLPKNALDCAVDHIGGIETRGDKTKVRGLCCQNGHCNRLAGMVEVGELPYNSLFHSFVSRVRKVIRQYREGGPLS